MEMANPKEIVNNTLQMFKSIQHLDYLNNQLSLLDKELQDIEHYLELMSDFDVQRGYKTYKDLREVRRKRRIVKNDISIWEPITFFCKDNPEFKNKLLKVVESLNTVEQKQLVAEYTPRVRHDLFPKKECIKNEVKPDLEKLIQGYKKQRKERKR